MVLAACTSPGGGITCGPGTVLHGTQCVPASSGGGGAAGGGAVAGGRGGGGVQGTAGGNAPCVGSGDISKLQGCLPPVPGCDVAGEWTIQISPNRCRSGLNELQLNIAPNASCGTGNTVSWKNASNCEVTVNAYDTRTGRNGFTGECYFCAGRLELDLSFSDAGVAGAGRITENSHHCGCGDGQFTVVGGGRGRSTEVCLQPDPGTDAGLWCHETDDFSSLVACRLPSPAVCDLYGDWDLEVAYSGDGGSCGMPTTTRLSIVADAGCPYCGSRRIDWLGPCSLRLWGTLGRWDEVNGACSSPTYTSLGLTLDFTDAGLVGSGKSYRTANSMGNCEGIATLVDAGR